MAEPGALPPGEAPRKAFPLRLRWREQYPLRCDSLEHPSLEQSRLHCFPLNFLRIPLGVETTSPFLYLCGVPGGRDRGEDGVDLQVVQGFITYIHRIGL